MSDDVIDVVPCRVSFDTQPDGIAAWTNGDHWNGFACPWFDRSQVDTAIAYIRADAQDAIAAYAVKHNPQSNLGEPWIKIQWDPATETVQCLDHDAPDEPYAWPAQRIRKPDGAVEPAWPIGAYAWCWLRDDE